MAASSPSTLSTRSTVWTWAVRKPGRIAKSATCEDHNKRAGKLITKIEDAREIRRFPLERKSEVKDETMRLLDFLLPGFHWGHLPILCFVHAAFFTTATLPLGALGTVVLLSVEHSDMRHPHTLCAELV